MKQSIEQKKSEIQLHKVELLAPAGSYECMRAAVNAGADAVYMGGSRFGARAFAENPEQDALLQAIDWMHVRGKKLYLTVNTLLKEAELTEELERFLMPLYRQGLDAVIVQDVGVIRFLTERFPDLAIHLSTQMTINSADAVKTVLDLAGQAGRKHEVQEGAAYILSTLDSNKTERYDVEISKINRDASGSKCFTVKITDPDLLAVSGGIVQGMSGSPIIQNGKLVGAVTHVLINDPTTGYGIFIENMLNAAQMPMAKAS